VARGPLTDELRVRRNEAMALELESVALRLFQEHGFGGVTVDMIAKEAGVSARTFYRTFPAKEDVFQLWIDARSTALHEEFAARPADETVFLAVRRGIEAQVAAEDVERLALWIDVVTQNPEVMASVLGGIQLKNEGTIAAFIAERIRAAPDDLVPLLLAGAFGRALLDAHARWYASGGDLEALVAESLDVLQRAVGDANLTRSP
jgi:AcrR family transcriptional regulator